MQRSPERHNLARLRLLLGLSQVKMSRVVGCSLPTIRAVELNKLRLSAGLAQRIAAATGISASWLLNNDLVAPPITPSGQGYASDDYVLAQVERSHPENLGLNAGISDELPELLLCGFARCLMALMNSSQKPGTYALAKWKYEQAVSALEAEFCDANHKEIMEKVRQFIDPSILAFGQKFAVMFAEGTSKANRPDELAVHRKFDSLVKDLVKTIIASRKAPNGTIGGEILGANKYIHDLAESPDKEQSELFLRAMAASEVRMDKLMRQRRSLMDEEGKELFANIERLKNSEKLSPEEVRGVQQQHKNFTEQIDGVMNLLNSENDTYRQLGNLLEVAAKNYGLIAQ